MVNPWGVEYDGPRLGVVPEHEPHFCKGKRPDAGMVIAMEVNIRTRCCGQRGRVALGVLRADQGIFVQLPKVPALREIMRKQMIDSATKAIDLILDGVE